VQIHVEYSCTRERYICLLDLVRTSYLEKVGELGFDQSVKLISAQSVRGTVAASIRLELRHQRRDGRLHH